MVRKLVVVFTSVVFFAAANVKALGLGEIVVESALNQPLAARIDLLQLGGVRPDQINVQLASESDFARFSIDRQSFLNSIRFNVESTGSNAYVRVTTPSVVREPYLSFVLETSWPSGRLLSEHTVLLDLPSFAASGQAAPIQQPVQNQASRSSQNTSDNQLATGQSSASSLSSPARLAAPEQPASAVDPAPQDALSGSNASDSSAADTAAADDVIAAPAPATPAPQPAEEPAQTPLAANSDTVSIGADDTLWDVALQVRPDSSVSVQQTMLALQRLNSEAFIGDNINMVRRGQVLRVPDIEQIRALSAREAISEVARQNQLFENRSNVPLTAQPVAAQPSVAPAGSSAGRPELSVVTTDSADSATAQSASGGRSAELDARIASLENELAVQQEEADRVALQNRELTERLGLLEQQIASAQEIIRLRDLELAQLQQALAQAEVEAAAAAEEIAPVDPPTVITMAPERSFLQTTLDTLIANTYALLAVTALLILMLVYVLLRRNKAAEEESLAGMEGMVEPSPAVGTAGTHSAFSASQSASRAAVDESELDEIFDLAEEADDVIGAEGFDAKTADDLTEVMEEADALIAHEHYDEASALLLGAIEADPERTDLRLKLLEVYVASQDASGFQLQETELRGIGGLGVIARIAALKSQLHGDLDDEILEEGEDDFFSELNALDDLEDGAAEDSWDSDSNDMDFDTLEESAGEESLVEDSPAEESPVEESIDTQPNTEALAETNADEEADENLLDFDFDFAVDEPESAAPADNDVAELEVAEDDPEHNIDFDFAVLDDDEDSASSSVTEELADDDDIEIEFDDEGEALATVEVDEDEFSFDDSEFDLDVVNDDQPQSGSTNLDVVEDDDLANLRFVDDDALEAAAEQNAHDAVEDEEFEFLNDTDEVATKLDLAQAYFEMGDHEGAREILEEVIDEGTDVQIKDARELLNKL